MTIEDRLDALEKDLARANHRNRLLFGCSAALFGLAAVGWFFVPRPLLAQHATSRPGSPTTSSALKVVRAHKFIVEDEKGLVRAELSADQHGSRINLSDQEGRVRSSLSVHKDGGSFGFFDGPENAPVLFTVSKGEIRSWLITKAGATVLSLTEQGHGLSFRDNWGKARLTLVSSETESGFYLGDEKDKTRVELAFNKKGPRLRLLDQEGVARVFLGATKHETGLVLVDEKNRGRSVLSLDRNGAKLGLVDERGVTRAILGAAETTHPDGKKVTYQESSLILFAPDGKSIWQTP